MEKIIKWRDGDGNITATYEGSGNGSAIITSDINDGLDREQSITVETIAGSEPKKIPVVVKQVGLRERYITADGEVYLTADEEIYGCLKDE